MEKFEALSNINNMWNDKNISLKEKIINIANDFYSSGLDLNTTASFINATPSELEALLSLSELEDDLINQISLINPPKIAWIFLANANSEEIKEALKAIKNPDKKVIFSEIVYKSMLDVSGLPPAQKINSLTGSEIKQIRVKAEQYQKISDKEIKFLKSIAANKAKRPELSEKQADWFLSILNRLVKDDVISRNSKDKDQDLCYKVLNCLGK